MDSLQRRSSYRRVEVDKDGSGDIFAIASLGEESFEGASIAYVFCVCIGTTVGLKTMFEEVSGRGEAGELDAEANGGEEHFNIQFPSSVPKLGASLANVKVADLDKTTDQHEVMTGAVAR